MISNANMINCKLADIAKLRGFKSAKALTDAMNSHMGLGISYSTIYPLWRNVASNYARVTLDRLCEFLNTSPGVLLEYAPGSEAEQTEDQDRRRAAKGGAQSKARVV